MLTDKENGDVLILGLQNDSKLRQITLPPSSVKNFCLICLKCNCFTLMYYSFK